MSQSSRPTSSTIIAGDSAILARRYAGALYALAEEQKLLDAVATDLRALKEIERGSQEFRSIAAHPRLTRQQLIKAMEQVSKASKFNNLTSNFLALLAQNRRLNELTNVVDTFLEELAARRGEYTADIRTAKALTGPQQEQLATKLRELAGGKVHLSIFEDKSLLGGIIVKLGSHLIDASIRSKLARLERQLKSPSFNTQKGAA